MKLRLVLLLAVLCLMLGGCSYWVIEDAPVQVGSAYIQPTSAPAR